MANNDPRNWGLGTETLRIVRTAAEVDAITDTELVRYANDTTNLIDGFSETRYALVRTESIHANEKHQTVYCYGMGLKGSVIVTRGMTSGVWGPFEWLNPLMEIGVEYRTTERYLGKPVYVKAFDFGALPNATQKVVQYGDDTTRTIRACAVDNHGEIISGGTGYVQNFTQWLAMSTDSNKVGISCTGDATNRTGCIVTVWYTKTTD